MIGRLAAEALRCLPYSFSLGRRVDVIIPEDARIGLIWTRVNCGQQGEGLRCAAAGGLALGQPWACSRLAELSRTGCVLLAKQMVGILGLLC